MIYSFGDVELDTQSRCLRRDGNDLRIEPKVFEVLHYLIANRSRVVGKAELHDAIWAGRIVSDSALSTCIKAARRATGDGGRTQRLIRTVHGRGFQFVGSVRVRPGTTPSIGGGAAPDAVADFRPIVQVTAPADALRPARSLEATLCEDMAHALSRFRELRILSPTRADRCLAPNYVVRISRRGGYPSGAAVAEMQQAETGVILWADSLAIADAGDRVSALSEPQRLAATLAAEIHTHERKAGRITTDERAEVRRLYYRGVEALYSFTRDGLAHAEHCLSSCLDANPRSAAASARLAYVQVQSYWYGGHETRLACLDAALDVASKAIELDSNEALGHFALGRALALGRRHGQAISVLESAVHLNPSSAQCWFGLGQAKFYAGYVAESLRDLDKAIELGRSDPHLWTFHHVKALSLYELGRLDEAEAHARTAIVCPHATHWAKATLASILGSRGNVTDCAGVLTGLLASKPEYSRDYAFVDLSPCKAGPFVDRYVSGLAAGGLQ